ncbi:hypothetical protein [Rhodoferax sp.]|uniref:hypothetical protein n=1 Tax=Rhodoferax sp. TaxID=50421 RepID=UPI00283E019A|nr:hypothetical protein [Rhodoferax sp.]MDR3370826.1 hypothetical protein [Rhodoferax sp.]
MAMELAAQIVERLCVFLAQVGQLQIHVAVAVALSPADAVQQLAKQRKVVAQCAGGIVKKAGGIDGCVVKLGFDLARRKPLFERLVLLGRGQ